MRRHAFWLAPVAIVLAAVGVVVVAGWLDLQLEPNGPLDFALHRARYQRSVQRAAAAVRTRGASATFDDEGTVRAVRMDDGTLAMERVVSDRHHLGAYVYLYTSNGVAPDARAFDLNQVRTTALDLLGVDNCTLLDRVGRGWWAARCGD